MRRVYSVHTTTMRACGAIERNFRLAATLFKSDKSVSIYTDQERCKMYVRMYLLCTRFY